MRLKQIDAQHLEIVEGGGCLSIFGLPFFAAGIFLVLAGLQVIPFENASEVPAFAYPVIFFMGIVFIAVGGGLFLGRTWRMIDLTRRCVIETKGVVLPYVKRSKKEHYLGSYKSLRVSYNPGDSDTAETFPIFLIPKHTQEKILLFTACTYKEALEQVERVARFIKFPIEEQTSDHSRVVEFEKIQDGLKGLWKGLGNEDFFPRPKEMISKVTQQSGITRIDIPGPKIKITIVLPLLVTVAGVLLLGPAVMDFFIRTQTPKFVYTFIIALVLILFVGVSIVRLAYRLIWARQSKTSVHIDKEKIIIEERSGWRKHRRVIAVEKIVDLDYGLATFIVASSARESLNRSSGGSKELQTADKECTSKPVIKWLTRVIRSKGVIIKSKEGFFSFGAGLPDAEVKYLYSVLKRGL